MLCLELKQNSTFNIIRKNCHHCHHQQQGQLSLDQINFQVLLSHLPDSAEADVALCTKRELWFYLAILLYQL
jgi:hypothetical protein